MKRLCKFAGVPDEDMKGKGEAAMTQIWNDQALPAMAEKEDDFVIILDAIEELEGSRDSEKYLCWLPPYFPSNVTCIVTSPVMGAAIGKKGPYRMDLGNIRGNDQKLVMERLLGKRLH